MKRLIRNLFLLAGLTTGGMCIGSPPKEVSTPAPAEKLVGVLGDTANFTFEGNKIISDADLRAGLKISSPFVIDSHPAAPLETFLERVSTSLKGGYQRSGFPDPKVDVAVNAEGDAIHVVIHEGERVRNGELIIEGVDATLAAILHKGLTEDQRVSGVDELGNPTSKDIHALWKPDEPTDCHAKAERWLRQKVGRLLMEEGWFAAEVDAQIKIKGEMATATVNVKSLGPGSIIKTIQIIRPPRGNRTETRAFRDSKADILTFLELEEGMKVTGSMINDSRRRLYESARFLRSDIKLERETPLAMEVDLKILLIEAEGVPPLNTPFSRETQAILKAVEWLENYQASDYDIVFSSGDTNGTTMYAALSRSEGLLLALRFGQEGGPANSTNLDEEPADIMLIVSASHLVVQVPGIEGAWRYEIKLPVEANIKVESSGDPKKPAIFSAGIHTSSTYREPQAVPLILQVDPVVIVGKYMQSGMQNAEVEWHGDVATWKSTHTNRTFSLNASTGRLIGFSKPSTDGSISVKTERGGFARLHKQLAPDASQMNRLSAAAPLSSSAAFFIEALQQLNRPIRSLDKKGQLPPPETIDELAGALLALINIGALAPADELVKKTGWLEHEKVDYYFEVPYENIGTQPSNPTLLMFTQMLDPLLRSVPENSWADLLFTEMTQVAHGNTRYTKQVLDSLYEDTENNGPIAYWLMANVLNMMDKKESARFAQQGLQHLTAEDFQHDWEPLVDDPAAERLFKEFIEAVPSLDARQQATLDRILGAEATAGAKDYMNRLGKGNTPALGAFLEPGMETLWDRQLRAVVEKQLNSVGPPPLEPDYTIATVNGTAITRRALTVWMGNEQTTAAQAREFAINAEAVYQYYLKKNANATQALMDKLMTEQAEIAAIMETAGVPSGFIPKALLYQEVMGRQLSGMPAPTDAELRAYYNRHSAAINKPFDEVKAQLAISLIQSRGSAHIEQWVRAIRQGCEIYRFEQKAPSPGNQ